MKSYYLPPHLNSEQESPGLTGVFTRYTRPGQGSERHFYRCIGCNCLHDPSGSKQPARGKDFCKFCYRDFVVDPNGFKTWEEKLKEKARG